MKQKLNINQIEFVVNNLDRYDIYYFAEKFNVHKNVIVGIISNFKNGNLWTKKQVDFLIKNKDKMTTKEISKVLNKSQDSITGKLSNLGLRKKKYIYKLYNWTKKDIKFLGNNKDSMTVKQLSKKLNKSEKSIYDKLKKLGLKKKNFQYLTQFKKGESHPPYYIKNIAFKTLDRLYNKEKKSIVQISRILKLSHFCITRNLKMQNITIRKPIFYHKGIPKPYMGERMKGEKNPNYKGKLWKNKEYREKTIKTLNSEKYLKLKSNITKSLWKNPDFCNKVADSLKLKPNKPEKVLINLFKLNNLPYKFIGDFRFWIDGKNPDFINCNGQKKLIELFGDYWHKGENPQDRIDCFSPYGFDTLVIWEHELKDIPQVLEKVQRFNNA